MFSLEFLHQIRRHEIAFVERHLPPGVRILEVGGGTGFQAKLLAEHGYDIASIDIPQSNYAEERVFLVLDYDSATIPFPDDSFDVVFSSNVLEHVRDRVRLYAEIGRVLKPSGFCLHAMPTGVWRIGEIITHYLVTGQRLALGFEERTASRQRQAVARAPSECVLTVAGGLRAVKRTAGAAIVRVRDFASVLRYSMPKLAPPRHGEFGNAFTEILTFSRFWWLRHFRRNGYEILGVEPMGLFYTGYMLRGANWPLSARERCARWLGSSCVLYKVRPGGQHNQPSNSDNAIPTVDDTRFSD